jgi:hypothetical protein
MTAELRTVLKSDLLDLVFETWINVSLTEPLDEFDKVIKEFLFEGNSKAPTISREVWPVLQMISNISDGEIDWMDFLPPVEDPTFPKQALGLILLLDQAPRSYFKGIDQRWTTEYFGELSAGVVRLLEGLPADQRPSSWARWDGVATFEAWVLLRIMFGAPLVHNERAADEAVAFTDETRRAIEARFGVRDPLRDQPERRWDLLGFPKLLKSRGPEAPCDVTKGGFWLLELMDVHKPPLDKYGRYPYRNWLEGRDMTPEEEEWLREADFFKPPPEDVIKKIREDVDNGIWSHLGKGTFGT